MGASKIHVESFRTPRREKNTRKNIVYREFAISWKETHKMTQKHLRERVITVDTYVVIKIANGRTNMKNRLKLPYSCSCQTSV